MTSADDIKKKFPEAKGYYINTEYFCLLSFPLSKKQTLPNFLYKKKRKAKKRLRLKEKTSKLVKTKKSGSREVLRYGREGEREKRLCH